MRGNDAVVGALFRRCGRCTAAVWGRLLSRSNSASAAQASTGCLATKRHRAGSFGFFPGSGDGFIEKQTMPKASHPPAGQDQIYAGKEAEALKGP